MVRRRGVAIRAVVVAAVALAGSMSAAIAAPDPAGPDVAPTPRAACGPGSRPESGAQGRVPATEVASGRAAQGYTCNTVQLGHIGSSGGYKVERYVDKAGHECAYYDTTLLFPANAVNLPNGELPGVAVLDMSNPSRPVRTATLATPAMLSPHESLSLNQRRGLLAAALGNPYTYPGQVDIYDVTADCRNPVLKSTTPLGVLGHESGWAPDGKTFWIASLHGPAVTALDVTDPAAPKLLATYRHLAHGLNLSEDGNRLYMTTYSNNVNNNQAGVNLSETSPKRAIVIYDVSDIQARRPSPQIREISRVSWALISTPQTAIPVTIKGRPFLVEIDEFANGANVGAARVIDIGDEKAPRVVSNLRLEVHQAAARSGDQANDPGASSGLQGYAGHYCNVPSRVDPGIVACTMILSGLRVFDIRDPNNPKEIAYFNGPIDGSAYAMSSPSFVPERGEIWYSDGNSGFWSVKVTNDVWPSASHAGPAAGAAGAATAAPARGSGGGQSLPATGDGLPVALGIAVWALVAGFASRTLVRRGAAARSPL